jgi:hypothetical protein
MYYSSVSWYIVYRVLFANVIIHYIPCIICHCYGSLYTMYYSSLSWFIIYHVLFISVMVHYILCVILQCHGTLYTMYYSSVLWYIMYHVLFVSVVVHYIHRYLSFCKYFVPMIACTGRNGSTLFKLVKHKIVVVCDEVYILFYFNIILKHSGMPFTKIDLSF